MGFRSRLVSVRERRSPLDGHLRKVDLDWSPRLARMTLLSHLSYIE